METRVEFMPQSQYDQCGLMIRTDPENWIKVSTEFENERISRLGSVVTNLGFSDWATQDITSTVEEMWYRVWRTGQDFFIESSHDGIDWVQMRLAHLHQTGRNVEAGPYVCSPKRPGFRCKFLMLNIEHA